MSDVTTRSAAVVVNLAGHTFVIANLSGGGDKDVEQASQYRPGEIFAKYH